MKIEYPELDEVLCKKVLSNGLTVTVNPRKDFTRKLAYFVTDYGAIHRNFRFEGKEYAVPAGIAHYLEHKMFDLPGRDVSEEFAQLGASTNAFTSYDMTAYYFGCTEHFEENLKLLLEFVSTPYFTEESVEKERGIIDQEIGMNRDSADSAVFENLMDSMYKAHPICVPILGTEESIRQITPENLLMCHEAFYHPENMLLCVIGDVDPEEVFAIAEEMVKKPAWGRGEKIRSWDEPMAPYRALSRREMEVAMPNFSLGFKCEALGMGDEAIRAEMVADLAAEALFGESSQLYLKLYEQGLIDTSFGGGFETVDGCAIFTCGGDSDDPLAVRDAILEEGKRLCSVGIDEGDFLRMKRSALGRRIRALDSFDGTCYRICAYHFGGFDYFRFPEIYQQIEKQEVEAFLGRVVRPERVSISIIDPISKEENHESC